MISEQQVLGYLPFPANIRIDYRRKETRFDYCDGDGESLTFNTIYSLAEAYWYLLWAWVFLPVLGLFLGVLTLDLLTQPGADLLFSFNSYATVALNVVLICLISTVLATVGHLLPLTRRFFVKAMPNIYAKSSQMFNPRKRCIFNFDGLNEDVRVTVPVGSSILMDYYLFGDAKDLIAKVSYRSFDEVYESAESLTNLICLFWSKILTLLRKEEMVLTKPSNFGFFVFERPPKAGALVVDYWSRDEQGEEGVNDG